MKSRFVVRRVVDRGPDKPRSLLLEDFCPEYPGVEDNPVDDVIHESQMAVTPSDFALSAARDGNVEGPEIHIEPGKDIISPVVGDVLDIEVLVVGRANG